MAAPQKQPTAPYNPFFGCAIMALAGIMFVGIVAWSIYSLLKQDSEIATFTIEVPAAPSGPLLPEAERPALLARVQAFATDAGASKETTLELSLAELNALIQTAPDTGYGSFREMIAFTGTKTDAQSLQAAVCLPLNKARFWEGKRYAVGEATFHLDVPSENGPDIRLTALSVPGKVVSEGFVGAFGQWRWLTPYHKLESIAPTLRAIKSVTITPAGLKLSTTPPKG